MHQIYQRLVDSRVAFMSVCKFHSPSLFRYCYNFSTFGVVTIWSYRNLILIIVIISVIFFAHRHKAAGVKTKQNVKQRLQRLLILIMYNCISHTI